MVIYKSSFGSPAASRASNTEAINKFLPKRVTAYRQIRANSDTDVSVHTNDTNFFHYVTLRKEGQDSSVGIATRYGLDGPGIKSRSRARFSAPIQTGPGAHTASYTMGTVIFPGGKAAGAWR